jgi:(p)ppGpp synthase/HD superfamily hydrolase
MCEHRAVSAAPGLTAYLAGRPTAERAAAVAAEAHAGQTRNADGAPFVTHPLEVGLLLHTLGYDDDVVCAGLLHDIVEKGGMTVEAVTDAFGPRVTEMVVALTEDEAIADYRARKAAQRDQVARASDDAVVVFAADKVSKAREARLAGAGRRLTSAELVARREHYRESTALIDTRLPGHPLADELRFELATQTVVPDLARLLAADAEAGDAAPA